MVSQYKDVCRGYGCKAKVFTQMSGAMKNQLGNPDLLIFFTGTVSHKMIHFANTRLKNGGTRIAHSHTSSLSALKGILNRYAV